MSENFTFPTKADDGRYIVADRVNITWDVVAPMFSLYETCGTINRALESKDLNITSAAPPYG